MAGVADLSLEFAHLYLGQLDEAEAERAARLARRWLGPVLGMCEEAGLTVSTVVMLDDYFAPDGTDLDAMVRLLDDACAAEGVEIDHLVHEAACAESVAELRTHLCREPREGDGSSTPPPPAIGSEWLANADPPRGRALEQRVLRRTARARPETAQAAGAARGNGGGRGSRGHHSIHLDVQLWKEIANRERLWACPTLAAWWQLIRLGMLRDEAGRPTVPPRTRTREGAPPLPARRTLTLLDPRFIEVEHAVRVILERVRLPETWRRYLREGEREPGAQEHLERIAYMFVPTGFAPRALARS
jgi:hypothetical protein